MSGVKALRVGSFLAMLLCFQASWAAPEIFTCDLNGKRISRDRYIEECSDREQRVHSPGGLLIKTVPPTLTPEARVVKERDEQEELDRRKAKKEAERADRNLMVRFPNDAKHQLARATDLDGPLKSIKLAETRLSTLAVERKVLEDEAEFYKGRTMPAKLKSLFDANDASTTAQRDLLQEQRSEVKRINARYDVELFRLKQLWSGVLPGSARDAPSTAAVVPVASAPTATPIRKASSK